MSMQYKMIATTTGTKGVCINAYAARCFQKCVSRPTYRNASVIVERKQQIACAKPKASKVWGRGRNRGYPVKVSALSGESGSQVPHDSVSVVLLAGGVGKRMGASIPKQYIKLAGKEIALYSFDLFASMSHVHEVIVVCEAEYEQVFRDYKTDKKLEFARPGKERQDSAFNGFQMCNKDASLIAIHDSARPLLTPESALNCFEDAFRHGAAVLGVPAKNTIKEVNSDNLVVRTPDRATLWEVQTPQVIKPDLLKRGFEKVKSENLQVTDDVSIIEQLGEPVFVTTGDYQNIKLTTPEDLQLAESVFGA